MFNYATDTVSTRKPTYNEGLRLYLMSVFQNMGFGLAITAIVSMLVASSPSLMQLFFSTPFYWVVVLSPLFMVFFISSRIMSMSLQGAKMAFFCFSALMGVSLASIYFVYTSESIAKVFFITASLFGAMSIYGHVTKKDLSSWGAFLFMGVLGLVIVSFANIFLKSSALADILSYIGVIVFTLFTAYDVQRLKMVYNQMSSSGELVQKISVYGSLTLYIDFVNLFLSLLRIFGDRK